MHLANDTKTFTCGHPDHFSNTFCRPWNFGCYLFTVSNFGLLLSNGLMTGIPNFTFTFNGFPTSVSLSIPNLNFDLWPWLSNMSNMGSRCTSTPYISVKVIFFSSYCPVTNTHKHTHTHTHTHKHTNTHTEQTDARLMASFPRQPE